MIKLIMLALAATTLTYASCTKSSGSSSSSTSSNTTPNTITVTDNGSSYTVKGVNYYVSTHASSANFVNVGVTKTSLASNLLIGNSGASMDFLMALTSINGPLSGAGTYTINASMLSTYKENFSGGQSYSVDTGVVNITTCSSSNVSGTFQLWLSNTGGSKTITGTINANQPNIQ
jgi:hypothetical protein